MTPEIERLAKEAGFTICQNWGTVIADEHRLAKFAALVVEDAAKLAADYVWWADQQYPTAGPDDAPARIAAAIRAKFAMSDLKDAAK